MKLVGKIFDSAKAGGVDGGHIAQAQDDNGRQGFQRVENVGELVRGAEEKWPVNAEDRGVLGNVLALQDVDAAVFDVIAGNARDGGGARNFANEHERGEDHADFDGKGEVSDDGEGHGQEPDGDVGGAELENFRDLLPFAHVVSDDHKDGGECGEGNVFHQRRGEQDYGEQRQRVDHSSDRCFRSSADVRRGARDGAGCGESAEERRDDVGDALGHELNVGIVFVFAHAVGDYRGH